ncbi:MAG: glycoside hydrolase family 1 protein [Candidatus Kerfeldbacteria bacterium]|nr:glycoside hydrolase family 1 protein [Candidatus Kerfeldbacteria bacterium]
MSEVFPRHFLWGAATSAHQVEGNNHNDWTEWEKLGLVKDQEHSGLATDHWHRYKQDFALAKDLGHNTHRLSIEWSRIEPRPGEFSAEAIEHYRQVLMELHRLGLKPIVTLQHFTLPTWVARQGGWLRRKTADHFARYVLIVIKELGSLAQYWITMNEPTIYTTMVYVEGYWPPQQKNLWSAWLAIRNLVTAHRLAYQVIHRHFPGHQVGAANNITDFMAWRRHNVLDQALRGFAHYWHNQWWLDQTYLTQDFIGLNFYFPHWLKFRLTTPIKVFAPHHPPRLPKNDLGWTIYPPSLGHVLDWLKHYQRPIIVTENGIADASDHWRADFIRRHVSEIEQARGRGVDVRGYIHWSLIDNFEWREGFGPRFGLVEIDYPTQKRTIRPSAYAFREIIRQHQAP